jgi:hypothetical protein
MPTYDPGGIHMSMPDPEVDLDDEDDYHQPQPLHVMAHRHQADLLDGMSASDKRVSPW